MIVCINCRPSTKSKMDQLLNSEHYSDYSELVAAAIDSFWVLAQELEGKGALVISKPSKSGTAPTSSQLVSEPKTEYFVTSKSSAYQEGVRNEPEAARIPELFLLNGLHVNKAPVIETAVSKRSDEDFTLDRWLFGQYNRLLPVKANCRALIRFAAEQGEPMPLDVVAPKIAEAAMHLGDYLAEHDRRHQLGRDDTLATAFPRSGPESEKSRSRYANHFVGSINTQNMFSGLLWEYRLAGLASEGADRVLPTKQALHLASLPNPILDGCESEPNQRFSSEEIAFLLDHIRAFVSVEAFAFRVLIQAIIEGAETPDKLDNAVRSLVPSDSSRSFSPSFLASQRSGALSRMADLGLIARIRLGVRVSYRVTQQGQDFIQGK